MHVKQGSKINGLTPYNTIEVWYLFSHQVAILYFQHL